MGRCYLIDFTHLFLFTNYFKCISCSYSCIPFTVLVRHYVQYIPRNVHTVTALLCFVVVIHCLIFPYPSGLLHWHCGNLTIAPVTAKQPWWIWINTSCEFIMNDCITTTKQSTIKPCAYFLGYTVWQVFNTLVIIFFVWPCIMSNNYVIAYFGTAHHNIHCHWFPGHSHKSMHHCSRNKNGIKHRGTIA